MNSEKERLENSLKDSTWKSEFRGKNIFSKLCSDVFSEDKIKIRQAYIDVSINEKPEIFNDIKDILENFK